jgi:translation initiation factor IF-2
MKKIRINELARDLEIKAHLIIDKLPELGVTEKKTHSSSVDEDVAEKLRLFFLREYTGERNGTDVSHDEPEEQHIRAEREVPTAPHAEVHEPVAQVKAPVATASEPPPPAAVAATTETSEIAAPPEPEKPPVRMSLRPPLASGPLRPPTAPLRPVSPSVPAMPPIQAAPAARATPQVPPTPLAPSFPAPQRPAPSQSAPLRPAPPQPRPVPTAPRPGQILSGPRQPLPASPAGPGPAVPRPSQAPGSPIARPPALRPLHAQSPGGAPQTSGPGPSRPIAPRGPLVGQPQPRPIVPPRPDLMAKLAQQQPPRAATPGAPAPLRTTPQFRSTPSPAGPGQPLYRGPARPGQTSGMLGARPGGPMARTGMPGSPRPGGPRPMHPTSRGFIAPPGAPPPPDQQRRAPSRGTQRPQHNREREEQEKTLRPARRDSQQAPPPINRDITISEGVTVKELSEKLDVKANLVIKKLVDRGIFATINQTLDSKLATDIARDFGASTSTISYEQEAMADVEIMQEDKDQVRRAPVVTIMGHVDHGKTSLLDAIRTTKVADREAGGITQHIGAYHVEKNGRKIVFIDTPGHEAFTRMRSRGAKVTDIVILVVAADDGVMPQTLEAIDHARAAKVPIIVAINKIDKPDAQPDRIKQQLSDRGLLAEDWGGDVVMVPVSARKKEGLDLLLEMVLLVADILDLKANPARPAMGTVLEAKLDRGRGPVPTILVRNGTLRVGDFFICGQVFGKVRAMIDDRGNQVRAVEPSMPVEVLGLDSLPESGDEFQVITDTAKAKQIVMYRESKARDVALAKNKRLTLEQFNKKMQAGEVKELPLILKADVNGSAEVLSDTMQRLSTDKVRVNVLRSGVGAITESDVDLASASDAIIIGFNVKPERNAAALAERENVDIRLHSIIYNLTDEIKKSMAGLLSPVYREIYRGKAEVRQTFRVSKVGNVAGCLVVDGNITRDCSARVMREGTAVHTGRVISLKRFKDDVSEVRNGMECGITLDYAEMKVGDVIEAFLTERVLTETI